MSLAAENITQETHSYAYSWEDSVQHAIEQCYWDTAFDNQDLGFNLQNEISQWSHSTLEGALVKVFEQYCPPSQVWRIDRLVIDLGPVGYDQLSKDISLKFISALQQSLNQLLAAHNSVVPGLASPMEIHDPNTSWAEIISYFLGNGTLPWWCSGQYSFKQIIDERLRTSRDELSAVLRGISNNHRSIQRLVWQLGDSIHPVIELLQPFQSETIIGDMEMLFAVHKAGDHQFIKDSEYWVSMHIWALSFILSNQGKVFNRSSFIHYMLESMATLYNLDYKEMLQSLRPAVSRLRHSSAGNTLLLVDGEIQREAAGFPDQLESGSGETIIDYWMLLEKALYHPGRELSLTTPFAELLTVLSSDDRQRAVKLIKAIGKSERVSQSWAKAFTTENLHLIVRVLRPLEHSFIVTHVASVEHSKLTVQDDSSLVWAVVLAYLLDDDGSHFNRRQFIGDTLLRLSQTYHYSYYETLQLLLQSVECQGSEHRFELFCIISELYEREYQHRNTPTALQLNAEKRLTEYFVTGLMPDSSDLSSLHPIDFILVNAPKALPYAAVNALKVMGASNKSCADIAGRLMAILGPSQMPVIISAFCSGDSKNILQWIDQIKLWHKKGGLPSLASVAYGSRFYEIILLILIRRYSSSSKGFYSLPHFLDAFTEVMVDRYFVRKDSWLSDLASCLKLSAKSTSISSSVGHWLSVQSNGVSPATLTTDMPSRAVTSVISRSITQDPQGDYLSSINTAEWCQSILMTGLLPETLSCSEGFDVRRFFSDLLRLNPGLFIDTVNTLPDRDFVVLRLSALIDIDELIDAIFHSLPASKAHGKALLNFNTEMMKLPLNLFPSWLVSDLLLEFAINSWLDGNLYQLTLKHYLVELFSKLILYKHFSRKQLVAVLSKHKHCFIPANYLTIESVLNLDERLGPNDNYSRVQPQTKPVSARYPANQPARTLGEYLSSEKVDQSNDVLLAKGVAVNNAGMVLLQGYFSLFFEKLGLISEGVFKSPLLQRRAIHFLQYLATGCIETQEHHLLLNKVLCGYSIFDPIEAGIEINDEETVIAESLITAMIDHWDAIGESSIEGFRGNWLIRKGQLIEKEDRWDLIVEKKAYDVLLQRSPFTFSLIKFPWMQKPLYVTWPT